MRSVNRLSARTVATVGSGKYNDGASLWLYKREDGGGQWVLRYTIHGRRREMGLGAVKEVSLKRVRELAEHWRGVVQEGHDPIREREKTEKRRCA